MSAGQMANLESQPEFLQTDSKRSYKRVPSNPHKLRAGNCLQEVKLGLGIGHLSCHHASIAREKVCSTGMGLPSARCFLMQVLAMLPDAGAGHEKYCKAQVWISLLSPSSKIQRADDIWHLEHVKRIKLSKRNNLHAKSCFKVDNSNMYSGGRVYAWSCKAARDAESSECVPMNGLSKNSFIGACTGPQVQSCQRRSNKACTLCSAAFLKYAQ